MTDRPKKGAADARNQGESSRTAAKQYNDAQRRFVESGKVDRKAHEAEQALDKDKRELARAEAVGKRHAAAEDPEVERKY